MHSWLKKHRPALHMYASRALNVSLYPTIGEHCVFMVEIRLRPDERRPENLFTATSACPRPFSNFAQAETREMFQRQWAEENERHLRSDGGKDRMSGVFLIILWEVDTSITLAIPSTFCAPAPIDMSMLSWKEPLLEHLNTGNRKLEAELIGEVPV